MACLGQGCQGVAGWGGRDKEESAGTRDRPGQSPAPHEPLGQAPILKPGEQYREISMRSRRAAIVRNVEFLLPCAVFLHGHTQPHMCTHTHARVHTHGGIRACMPSRKPTAVTGSV